MSDNFKKIEEKGFRYYQAEADDAIYEELLNSNKCIVKMFCGTGKSLLMRKCKSAQNQNLVVYVFPSLSLIRQFCADYFTKKDLQPFKISSDKDICIDEDTDDKIKESTTDPAVIRSELTKPGNKIICVTYQSYKTLLDNLGSTKIDVCIYDEAHHAVGETYQKLIFEHNVCKKQIFFTATPKDDNGIVMCDKEIGICGRTVYDYTYLRGLHDGHLNPFEIRVDMYTENTNKSVYESIARAILVSGNNRILTFHAKVSGGESKSNSSVLNFVKEYEFICAFNKVIKEEFPEKEGIYTKFRMIGLHSGIEPKDRETILNELDVTTRNSIYIISSCETIGEGIDTKNANMCVFVDPKSSFVKIIQNIGRIVRPQSKPSTVLIPCWVDKTKYVGCDEDREKCDEVIRSDLNKDGNFNGILNVLSALRQEDEDLYDICLHYPDTYSPQEIRSNLEKHGYKVLDPVGDGELLETMEYLLDTDIDYDDYEDCETNEEMIMRIAEDNDVCVEVHTNSFENQIEKYNSECESGEVIRLYKEEEDDEGEGNQMYCPIVKKCGKRKGDGSIKELDRKDRIKIDVHTNPDVKVLWKLVGDFTKEICSCVLECEVEKYDPMEVAKAIVSRKTQRPNMLPRSIRDKQKRNTPELEQENKDAQKLSDWKKALKGQGSSKCSDEVRDYLDKELEGWRTETDFDEKALEDAKAIVSRKPQRPNMLPRSIPNKQKRNTPELEQENKDAVKLANWKTALKGQGRAKCSDEVRDYLDKELEGWRTETDFDEKALEDAKAIVSRKTQRPNMLPRSIPNKQNRITPELEQENKDAQKLSHWKKALKGQGSAKCSDEVRDYLDKELEGWRTEIDEKALEDAKAIVSRKTQRPNMLPRSIPNKQKRNTPELEQEYRDATKLSNWKTALKGQGYSKCSDEVRDYLDKELEGWRTEIDLDEKALEDAKAIVSRKTQRPNMLPRSIRDKQKRNTPELEQEHRDATKLSSWKQALKGQGDSKCSDEVRDYLDKELEGWRTVVEEETPKPKKSMKLKEPSAKKETPEQKLIRAKSKLSVLHQRYKTLTSQNLQKEFQENPEKFYEYHDCSEENEKSFTEESIPRNRIIQVMNERQGKRTQIVVDMGCGRAHIAAHFANDRRFTFINYDHVSSNENILVQDISQTPLEDHSVEICILCLAMWGSNCHDYVREAYRILESGGKLYMVEATKRWTSEATESEAGGPPAGKLASLLEKSGFKIVKSSVEKFCLFVCTKM